MAPRLAGYATEIRLIEQDIAKPAVSRRRMSQPVRSGLPDMFIVSIKEHPLPGSVGAHAVARAIDRAIPFLVHPGGLYLLKANVAFKLHQFANVQSALRAVPSVYTAMKVD